MAERWLTAWALVAMAFGGASLIVPLYVVELGGDAFVLGILFASSSFVGVPGALGFGTFADRTGRRRIFVLVAFAVTALSMGLIPFLEDITAVIVVHAILWLGFAAVVPVLNLVIVAEVPSAGWSARIGRLNRYQGIGWALGLAIGFVIIAVGGRVGSTIAAQRAFFLTCAFLASVGFVLGLVSFPADGDRRSPPSRRRLEAAVRRAPRFNVRSAAVPFAPGRFDPRDLHTRVLVDRMTPALATFFLAVFLFFTGFGVFFAPLPAFLDDVGSGADAIFVLYLALNLGAATCFGYAGLLVSRYDLTDVHVGGLAVRGIALPVVAIVGLGLGGSGVGLVVLAMIFLVMGVAWAVIVVSATTLVTTLAPSAIRGQALGVYGGLSALGGGVGGLLGGWLAGVSFWGTFVAAAGCVLAGAAIVYVQFRSTTPVLSQEAEAI